MVEDDIDVRQALHYYFSDRNFIQAFSSAEEAFEHEGEFGNVDIFILDYKLPGMNGIDFFKKLRVKFPRAKFVLITGEMSYDMFESNREIGFDALILKPFDFAILEDNISDLTSATA